ncbi:hypothetical protein Hdeb2414_s0016g00472441 [Helianthus debilis subsp. tardiflorus]
MTLLILRHLPETELTSRIGPCSIITLNFSIITFQKPTPVWLFPKIGLVDDLTHAIASASSSIFVQGLAFGFDYGFNRLPVVFLRLIV